MQCFTDNCSTEPAQTVMGKDVAAVLMEELIWTIREYKLSPCLSIIRVGSDESDLAYERGISRTCELTGIRLKITELDKDISQSAFEEEFIRINKDPAVDGILLFRPLPEQLDEKTAASLIDPEKDMDCMSDVNWAKLMRGDQTGYFPCTAEAVIRICDHMKINYNGAKAVVVGRSLVIGKPVGLMLLSRNATVTICHSKTKDLAKMCEGAEILVSACGQAGMIGEEIACGISADCAAIDVGVNFYEGRMCGDMDFEAVSRYAGWITPVPGGVGAVTNTILAQHVVRAALKKCGKD